MTLQFSSVPFASSLFLSLPFSAFSIPSFPRCSQLLTRVSYHFSHSLLFHAWSLHHLRNSKQNLYAWCNGAECFDKKPFGLFCVEFWWKTLTIFRSFIRFNHIGIFIAWFSLYGASCDYPNSEKKSERRKKIQAVYRFFVVTGLVCKVFITSNQCIVMSYLYTSCKIQIPLMFKTIEYEMNLLLLFHWESKANNHHQLCGIFENKRFCISKYATQRYVECVVNMVVPLFSICVHIVRIEVVIWYSWR